jgi:hypothetical protein
VAGSAKTGKDMILDIKAAHHRNFPYGPGHGLVCHLHKSQGSLFH